MLGGVTNPKPVSANGPTALARLMPAAAAAMQATNAQRRLLHKEETAYHKAVSTVAAADGECFESFETNAVQRLETACEAALKIEDNVRSLTT